MLQNLSRDIPELLKIYCVDFLIAKIKIIQVPDGLCQPNPIFMQLNRFFADHIWGDKVDLKEISLSAPRIELVFSREIG